MANKKELRVVKIKKGSFKSKFLLTDIQIETLKDCHQKIIRDELVQMGISQAAHKPYLDSSTEIFKIFIKNTQDELLAKAEMADIKEDILNG